MTEERERAKTEIETHQVAIRKIEADVRERLVLKKSLEPATGLMSFFSSAAPDPAKLEEVTFEVQVLMEELKLRRQQLVEVRDQLEAMDQESRKVAMVPVSVVDADAAALVVHAVQRLEPVLAELRGIAAATSQARTAQRSMRIRGRRGGPAPSVRMADMVRTQAGKWESLLDQAEVFADAAGMELVLPRRYMSAARPDHAPQPDPGVAAARQATTTPGDVAFGAALELVQPKIQQAQSQCLLVREAVLERFPAASGLAATLPPNALMMGIGVRPKAVAPEPVDGQTSSPDAEFIGQWERLQKVFHGIASIRPGARTMEYLEGMSEWQRQATHVRSLPAAERLQLVPPVNDGQALGDFVARLREEWPALNARFEQWRGGQ